MIKSGTFVEVKTTNGGAIQAPLFQDYTPTFGVYLAYEDGRYQCFIMASRIREVSMIGGGE